MVPPDLVAYIREQSAQGIPAQSLREALLEAGWGELDVENALHDVAAGMEPLTTGASLHEDVAQVRGMVAHLATRIQRLEARLTAAASETLPSGELLQLPRGHRHGLRTFFSWLLLFVVVVGGGVATWQGWYVMHRIEWSTALALGVLLLVMLVVVGRWIRHSART